MNFFIFAYCIERGKGRNKSGVELAKQGAKSWVSDYISRLSLKFDAYKKIV